MQGREIQFRRKSGEIRTGLFSTEIITVNNQQCLLSSISDITERKQVEEALQHERDFAESLIETAQVIVLALDLDGRIVRFNPYMEEISGYRLAEVQGKDWFSTFLPERGRERIHSLFLKAIGDIQTRGNLNSIVTKEGREREIEWYDKTLRDAQGNAVGLLAIGQDISERKRAGEQLAYQAKLLALVNDAIVASDSHYTLTAWNVAAEAMYGWKAEEVIGRPGLDITRTDFGTNKDEMLRTIAEKGAWRGEVTQARKDGTRFPVEVSSLVLHDETGKVSGYVSVNRDITERKRAEQEIAHLASFPRLNPNPVLEVDAHGTITFQNDATTAWLEQAKQDARVLLPPDLPEIWQTFAQEPSRMVYREVEVGDVIWGETIHHVPQFDVARIYATDITKRKRAEELLQTRMRLMEFAAAHSLDELLQKTLDEVGELTDSPIGFYHFVEADQKTLSLQMWSTRTLKEFCTAQGKGLHYNVDEAGVWVDCVHQRRPVIHNDYASLPHRKGMPEGHAQVIRELVVPIMRGERIVAILGVGNKPSDYTEEDAGLVTHLADVAWEIVERKRAETALQESEERYRTLVESQGEGVGFVDPDERFIYANPAAESIFGVPPGSLVGRNIAEFVTPEQWAAIREQTSRRRAGEKSAYEVEIVHPDGEKRSILVTATPKFDDAGQFIGAFGIFRDITDRRQAAEKLKYLSTHDALTGLYNRTFFEEETARLERGRQHPVCIVMADVDDLKVTNDRDGHAAGDDLLRRTAQVLNASFRAEDIIARIGGDEFVVLLPNADAAAAEQALTRVRKILHDHNAAHGGTRLRLSLGASTAEKGGALAEALKQADARMYQEKHGR